MDELQEQIREAKGGNDAAMTKIIEQYMRMIDENSYINGVLNEDCKHEIIEAVIKAIRKYRG